MIDSCIVAVVRLLLKEPHPSDRTKLIDWIEGRAIRQLGSDPRRFHRFAAESAHDVGVEVGSRITETRVCTDGMKVVPELHRELLYRTARLGAPDIRSELKPSDDPRLFSVSREFLLAKDDECLYIALSCAVSSLIQNALYLALSKRGWRRTKANLSNLVDRMPSLTMVSASPTRRYVVHSKFFEGVDMVRSASIFGLPGRVMSGEELDRLMSASPVDSDAFADVLTFWLNDSEPVFIGIDALATSRFDFYEALGVTEAPWAYEGVEEIRLLDGLPLAVWFERIRAWIAEAVEGVLDHYAPQVVRKTTERASVWKDAAVLRLEEYFSLGYEDEDRPDWYAALERGLAGIGPGEDRSRNAQVVGHVYGEAKALVRQRLHTAFEV